MCFFSRVPRGRLASCFEGFWVMGCLGLSEALHRSALKTQDCDFDKELYN